MIQCETPDYSETDSSCSSLRVFGDICLIPSSVSSVAKRSLKIHSLGVENASRGFEHKPSDRQCIHLLLSRWQRLFLLFDAPANKPIISNKLLDPKPESSDTKDPSEMVFPIRLSKDPLYSSKVHFSRLSLVNSTKHLDDQTQEILLHSLNRATVRKGMLRQTFLYPQNVFKRCAESTFASEVNHWHSRVPGQQEHEPKISEQPESHLLSARPELVMNKDSNISKISSKLQPIGTVELSQDTVVKRAAFHKSSVPTFDNAVLSETEYARS
ncbi:hypothetical protein Tco_0535252 [Tanacetum coccineum]